MSSYFFDSSALLKRYIAEIGTTWIRAILAKTPRDNIVIAQIAQVELISAIMRRKRDGTVPNNVAQATRILIDKHLYQEYHVVRLTEDIIYIAEDLLDKYPLRSYDAVQLASAVYVYQSIKQYYQMIFVSSDNRLLEYAKLEGFITDDPNQHP